MVRYVLSAAALMLAVALSPPARAATRAPIDIVGDGDFKAQNGVTGGTGTARNPYIIEGHSITAPTGGYGIRIRYTTRSFVIRNVWVSGGAAGISLEHLTASVARIEDSYAYGATTNVLVAQSSNVTLHAPTVFWGGDGIAVVDSHDVYLDRVSATHNRVRGVYVYRSDSVTIGASTLANNGSGTFPSAGLFAYDSPYVSVVGSTVASNVGRGLVFEFCDEMLVAGSDLTSNQGYGVALSFLEGGSVYGNNFVGNNASSGGKQGFDERNWGAAPNQWSHTVTGGAVGNYWKDFVPYCGSTVRVGSSLVCSNDYPLDGANGNGQTFDRNPVHDPVPRLVPVD
jgi:hypothetical protein